MSKKKRKNLLNFWFFKVLINLLFSSKPTHCKAVPILIKPRNKLFSPFGVCFKFLAIFNCQLFIQPWNNKKDKIQGHEQGNQQH